MIVIADSGGSKTDWRIISKNGEISQYKTMGLNPFLVEAELIRRETRQLFEKLPEQNDISIFFYGAGCASKENSDLMSEILTESFHTTKVEVNTDLLGAARALCNREPGIICILGTGANSCLFDGKNIVRKTPSLGYILGDEGSGAYLGKSLINQYFGNNLPQELATKLEQRFRMNRDEILAKVYKEKQPAQYLASFSKFLFDNKSHPYIHELIYQSFKLFYARYVSLYKEAATYPIHFTGSIAFYYNTIIRQAGKDLGLIVKNVVETPIAGLTLFHQSG